MPRIYVQDYDTNVDFPDNIDPDEIKRVLQAKFPSKQAAIPQAPEEYNAPSSLPESAIQDPNSIKTGLYGVYDTAKQAVGNIPQSAYNFGKSIVNAVTPEALGGHGPLNTIADIGKVAVGGIEKMLPGGQIGQEQNFDAFVNSLKEKYGGLENLRKTFINDPVGMAGDISALLGVGGGVAKLVGAPNTASTLLKASNLTNPITAITAPIGQATKLIPEGSRLDPVNMYQGALKPTTTNSPRMNRQLVTTGLEEGVPVSLSGYSKLQKSITGIQKEINSKIDELKQGGETLSREKILQPVQGEITQRMKTSALPSDTVPELQKVVDEFKPMQGTPIGGSGFRELNKDILPNVDSVSDAIPLDVAQKMKVGLNEQLTNYYNSVKKGQPMKPQEWAEARALLGDGFRQEMYNLYPELKSMNMSEGMRLNLNRELARAVNRIGNLNIIPLVTAVLRGESGFRRALGAFLIDNPAFKSKMAIVIHKARNNVITPKVPYSTGLYEAGQLDQSQE